MKLIIDILSEDLVFLDVAKGIMLLMFCYVIMRI